MMITEFSCYYYWKNFPHYWENPSTDLMDLSERRIGLIFHNNE